MRKRAAAGHEHPREAATGTKRGKAVHKPVIFLSFFLFALPAVRAVIPEAPPPAPCPYLQTNIKPMSNSTLRTGR